MTVESEVSIIYRFLPHYRVPFYEQLKVRLAEESINLRLLYGQPSKKDSLKRDTLHISWAEPFENREISLFGITALWQPVMRDVANSQLVIVEQASKLLTNYALLASRRWRHQKVAFWGHGKNFQAHTAAPGSERLKRLVSRCPDWWFAYNDLSAGIVKEIGFPPGKITSVHNTIDTSPLIAKRNGTTVEQLGELRSTLGIAPESPVGIFVGGIYEEKRPQFLVDSVIKIRELVPNFEFIVLGSGNQADIVKSAAETYPFIHYIGPVFEGDRAPYFMLADVQLMPGAVGLAVIDSFAMGVPLVTTEASQHGPEIDYVRSPVNGIVVSSSSTPGTYADEVARLLRDRQRLNVMKRACETEASKYQMRNMVERFSKGVLDCLGQANS